MKGIGTRIARLENRLALNRESDPDKRMRIVVCRMNRQPLSLENSSCTRTLSVGGFLTEVVRLDGTRAGLSDDELECFTESFPIQRETAPSAGSVMAAQLTALC
jgi:hypothetical protein